MRGASRFPEPLRARSQPIGFARADAPAALLVHGDDDDTVSVGNSERLAAALTEAGAPVQLRIYDGVGHARVVAALASPLDRLAPTARDILAFLDNLESFRRTGTSTGAANTWR